MCIYNIYMCVYIAQLNFTNKIIRLNVRDSSFFFPLELKGLYLFFYSIVRHLE